MAIPQARLRIIGYDLRTDQQRASYAQPGSCQEVGETADLILIKTHLPH